MMVARSGMFVAPLAGTPPVGMSPTDGRIAFSALLGTTPQTASGGAITQSPSTMATTVAAAVWQLPDVSNATGTSTFLSATDPFTLTPAAGPGTGSRIDLLCVKQNNVENSDADSRANVVLVAGIAGAPGVAPAIPAGAYLYATMNVPTAAANAAACTVVIARPTSFAILPVRSPTFALLSTVVGVQGQTATTSDSNIAWQYYALFNVSTNPVGARVAGWYPAPGADVFIRLGGSASQQNLPAGSSTPQATSFGTPKCNMPLSSAGGVFSNAFFQWNSTNGQMKILVEGRYSVKARAQVNNTTGVLQSYLVKNATTVLFANALAFEDFQLSSTATHTSLLDAPDYDLLSTDYVSVVLATTVTGNSNSNTVDGSMLLHLRWLGVTHA